MKKLILIPVLLTLVLFGSCGTNGESAAPMKNDVPVNDKGGLNSSDEEKDRKKDNLSDTDLANMELGAADESGVILRGKDNEYVLEQTVTEKVISENGEEAENTYSTGEEITFTVTKETEVKAVLYDAQSLNSRIVTASLLDIKVGVFASLYGHQAGGKFIASKVIILQPN
ncbi:hypothetical protein HQ708_07085 [Enterococcus faecium]|nr:hypothetical protein [Enterococcus faecium]